MFVIFIIKEAYIQMKKLRPLLSLLLCALIMLGMIPLAAQAQPAYATLDDLPIVSVSRPDMTPIDVNIAVDGNLIRVSTPSGKKDFKQVFLAKRNIMDDSQELK